MSCWKVAARSMSPALSMSRAPPAARSKPKATPSNLPAPRSTPAASRAADASTSATGMWKKPKSMPHPRSMRRPKTKATAARLPPSARPAPFRARPRRGVAKPAARADWSRHQDTRWRLLEPRSMPGRIRAQRERGCWIQRHSSSTSLVPTTSQQPWPPRMSR